MTKRGKVEKLKGCPWCGKKARVYKFLGIYNVDHSDKDCPMMPLSTDGYDTREEAISAWNRRK